VDRNDHPKPFAKALRVTTCCLAGVAPQIIKKGLKFPRHQVDFFAGPGGLLQLGD